MRDLRVLRGSDDFVRDLKDLRGKNDNFVRNMKDWRGNDDFVRV